MFKHKVISKYYVLGSEEVTIVDSIAEKYKNNKDIFLYFSPKKELKLSADTMVFHCFPVKELKKLFIFWQPEAKNAKYVYVLKKSSSANILDDVATLSKPKIETIIKEMIEALSAIRQISYTKNIEIYKKKLAKVSSVNSPFDLLKNFITFNVFGEKPEHRDQKEQIKFLRQTGYSGLQDSTGVKFFDKSFFEVIDTVLLPREKEIETPIELTDNEKKALDQYTPKFGENRYGTTISVAKFEEVFSQMTDDEVAWQLMNNPKASDLEALASDRIGLRERSSLMIQNKNISKRQRTEIAEWMIDKGGVSFVAGVGLNDFLKSLAKKGLIDRRILKASDEDDIRDKLYYGREQDPDKLRQYDVKKWGYQLAHNPHTPKDVLDKIIEVGFKEGKKENSWNRDPRVSWTGSNPANGGIPGIDWRYHFADVVVNPNYPTSDLIKIYEEYASKYPIKTVDGMERTLWEKKDLPPSLVDTLIKHNEARKDGEKILVPPAAMPKDKMFDFWKKHQKGKSLEDMYSLDRIVEKLDFPVEILKDILKRGREEAREAAYKKLREMGAIKDEEVVAKVKDKLKFDGPTDLMKLFGSRAYLRTVGDEDLKFVKVTDEEKKKLQKELAAGATHDEFTFEVIDAYKISRQIHKDYDKTSGRIGNIRKGVYHGTSVSNAAGLLATGVNIGGEHRTGAMFGTGFYLAESSSKAAQYASDNFSHEGLGIIFKIDVALGKNQEWKYGRPHKDEYPKDINVAKAREKYAKESGFESKSDVPVWHLTHDSVTAKAGMALKFDEFVVKNGNQIKIDTVILIKKEKKNG
jgi:hypothetical protein